MKGLITTGLLWIAFASFAQSVNLWQRQIGKMIDTQEVIVAKEYIFPEMIYHFHVDTISKSITVQLRRWSNNERWLSNNGKIVNYDFVEEKIKWSKKISYRTDRIQQFGNTVIFTTVGKSYCLNIVNGKKMWTARNSIYFVDSIAHIGVGYKYETPREYHNMLEGIDLKNGKPIWQKRLSRDYGWNDVFRKSDSVWMIVASGLRTINIYDGSGWSYNTVTGEKDYKIATAINAAGLAAGLMTGTFFFTTGHDLIRDIVSNVHSNGEEYYFASKEIISRINKDDGKVIWMSPIPENLTSKSFVFTKDDIVFMVN